MVTILLKSLARRFRSSWCFVLAGLLGILSSMCLFAQSSGAIDIVNDDGDSVPFYSSSHALLIGISKYDHWPDLLSIPDELDNVKAMLVEQGFEVTTVLDPDQSTLWDRISSFTRKQGNANNSRLIIYYAGHGHTWSDREQGFLVPADAPLPITDDGYPGRSFTEKALPISQMVEWARQMTPTRHALFLFDSCFSGTVFDVGRSQPAKAKPAPKFILNSAIRPVRQFISAGMAGEKVPARSTFTPEFVDAIRFGEGDKNDDGYVTGAELGLHLQQLVPEYAKQTPQFGKHPDHHYSQGDFVFVVGKRIKNEFRPILDDDIRFVDKRFNFLKSAIENRHIADIEQLVTTSDSKNALFEYLFDEFESIDVSLGDISAQPRTQSIKAVLTIDRMIKANGDTVLPAPKFKEITIRSIRNNGVWSLIHW